MISLWPALLPLALSTSAGATLSGAGRTIDGDSLMVGREEVRLFGIDAPEFAQTCTRGGQTWACGSAAADQLATLIAGKQVACTSLGSDQHGRALARCTAGSTDLNRVMVASGYAVAFRHYSFDYISAEDSARVGKRGIWAGTFKLPSAFRHGADDHTVVIPRAERDARAERLVVAGVRSKSQPSGGCRIKGNRSRKGDWIYHLPGMAYYEQTVAEEIFCSEAEARAAGYRRSRADQH